MSLATEYKNTLRTTPPLKDHPQIQFPEHFKQGRIIIEKGVRILDWEGDKWVAYEKDGVQWFPDRLSEDDYELLNRIFDE